MEQGLLFKYFRGKTTADEEDQILAWVEQSEKNKKEFREAHLIFAGMLLYAQKPTRERMPYTIPIWRKAMRHTLRAAAVVALMVGAGYLGKVFYHDMLEEQNMTLSVPNGQRMQIVLADGSCVQLNSGTTLEYPVVFGKNRKVKLSGEAMFEVEHDAKHPFIVETFASEIEVLGTKFNVKAKDDCGQFSTTLIEGRVQVTSRSNPDETFILQPNEMVSLDNGRLYKKHVANFADLCWTEGLIHLKKMPFDELMAVFEQAFDVKIDIQRDELPQINVVRGEVRISDGVDHAFNTLQQVCSEFTYIRDERTNMIIIK